MPGSAGHRHAPEFVAALVLWFCAIMMVRTQITLEPEIQRHARQRASDLGLSLAEYVRRIVARDLGGPQEGRNPSAIFDLGASGGSDVASNKDGMLDEAFASGRPKLRGRKSARS